MRLHYTLFAQSPSGNLSGGTAATVNAQEANYSLFSLDNSGQISDTTSIKILYVLNNYTLYSSHLGEFSVPLSDSCIVSPMQVPRNLRIVERYTTHKTIKLEWDAIEGIHRYAIYVRNLETSEAWKFESIESSYIALNLRPNNLYEFKVAAHIQYDFFSETSLPVVASTLASYFGNINVSATTTSIQLDWANVAGTAYYIVYPGIPGISINQNYSLFAYDSSGQSSLPLSAQITDLNGIVTTDPSYLAENLQNDSQHLFYIVAYDLSDMPLTAAYVFASTLAIAPAFADTFSYTIENITTKSIEVSWDFAIRAHFYRIHLNNNPMPYLNFIYQPKALIKGLSPDTIYTIKIIAVNSGGESSAPIFSARTAIGSSENEPLLPPRLLYPNCSQITTDFVPSLYWQPLQSSNTAFINSSEGEEFAVSISTNQDFTNFETFNSAHSKTGFSYEQPVVDTKDNKSALSFKTQTRLTKP